MASPTQELLPGVQKRLALKLAEACDQVGGIEKLGVNETQRYKYLRAADVAKAIRHELFQRGIVVIADELECHSERIEFTNAKGEKRQSTQVTVKTAYNITDGTETLTMHGFGIAWDAGDKAIYKAKTGALKYFLRGLGLIPDEKDDPEADESVDRATRGGPHSEETNEQFDQRTEGERCIALFQVNAIKEACLRTKKTEAEAQAYLDLIGEKRIEDIKRNQFDAFLKWANSTPKKAADSKPAKSTADMTRQKQMAKLFAIAGKGNVPEDDLKQMAYERYQVDSMTKLSNEQLADAIEWVEAASERTTEAQ